MNKWDDYFDIVQLEIDIDEVVDRWYDYKLVIRSDRLVVGTYKDFKYAKKQAKRKFKIMMKNIERTLLGG